MTEHKTDMKISKIGKGKKLNMTEHKPGMNITNRLNSTPMTAQNRVQLPLRKPNNKNVQMKQTSKLPTKKVNENI